MYFCAYALSFFSFREWDFVKFVRRINSKEIYEFDPRRFDSLDISQKMLFSSSFVTSLHFFNGKKTLGHICKKLWNMSANVNQTFKKELFMALFLGVLV